MRKVVGVIVVTLIYALIIFSALNVSGVIAVGEELPASVLTSHSKFWPGHSLGPQHLSGTAYSADINRSGELVVLDSKSGQPVRPPIIYGLAAQNLLVRGTRVFVIGRFSSNAGGPSADGFQIWDFSKLSNPSFLAGWRLPEEQVMTSLSVSGSAIYATSYVGTQEFVETSHFHIVQPGESLWSITRSEVCAGSETCTAQRWVELAKLNFERITWVCDPDGSAVPVIYAGTELKVTPMRYETSYQGTLWKLSFPEGSSVNATVQLALSRTVAGQKFELVFPDTRAIGAINLWTTASDGTDRQYLLDGRTLTSDPNLKGD